MRNNIKPMANEYDVFQDRNGVIMFYPKRKNPFYDDNFIQSHNLRQSEEFGGPLIGKEKLDD
ncbi:antitoxin of toxin-antitoxin stability system [Companilactobacillus sp. HBUAS59699]|uniref:antitoxin of toxin-antitoxin stability system n=1 Tax=Companilactobacillus sp. HBUAS59699 TaxID=3109358 RepID=UPI002FEEA834